MGEEKILRSMAVIRRALGGIGKDRFYQLVAEGLPVRKQGKIYEAHKDNLDAWWRAYTQSGSARG